MIIQTHDLTKRFGRHEAVRGLTLQVPEGATCALVGANGSGKTTALRLLVNLLQPDRGRATVFGIDSRRLRPKDFCAIGYVSDQQQLPESLSIESYCAYLRSLYPSWDRALELELRKQFELPADRPLAKLSRGMRMKAMLLGALAFRPKLLLLDEPLSGLDPLVRDEVLSGLLAQAGETTIVLCSHEIDEIEGCATHVACMVQGRLLLQDSIEALRTRFREISVTVASDAAPLRGLDTWLALQTQGRVARFVETAFSDDSELRSKLQAQAGTLLHFDSQPMSLREICKTLMRAHRAEVKP